MIPAADKIKNELKPKLRLILSFYMRYGEGPAGAMRINLQRDADARPSYETLEYVVKNRLQIGDKLADYLLSNDKDIPIRASATAVQGFIKSLQHLLPWDIAQPLSKDALEAKIKEDYPEAYAEYEAWNKDDKAYFTNNKKEHARNMEDTEPPRDMADTAALLKEALIRGKRADYGIPGKSRPWQR